MTFLEKYVRLILNERRRSFREGKPMHRLARELREGIESRRNYDAEKWHRLIHGYGLYARNERRRTKRDFIQSERLLSENFLAAAWRDRVNRAAYKNARARWPIS